MLIAENLKKVYKVRQKKGWFASKEIKKTIAVDNISMEIKPGQIIGLLGVNGAGKTTTIKMLSTLLEPTSGSFSVNGIDGIHEPQKVKEIINVITGGERNVYWRLTARENLEYFAALYNLPKSIIQGRIDCLLELVGLKEVVDTPVEQYSKGMKQRLQIARGLINDPEFLFLDEPTLGLDVSIAKEIRKYISNLAAIQNKGILLTTHYIAEVEELCDWVYVIDEGKVIAMGTPSGLAHSTKMNTDILVSIPQLSDYNIKDDVCKMAKRYDGTVRFETDKKEQQIIFSSYENPTREIVQFLTNRKIPILQLKMVEPRLEDVLIQLLAGGKDIEKYSSNFESRNYQATS